MYDACLDLSTRQAVAIPAIVVQLGYRVGVKAHARGCLHVGTNTLKYVCSLPITRTQMQRAKLSCDRSDFVDCPSQRARSDEIAILLHVSIGSRVNGDVRSRLSPGYNCYLLTYKPHLRVDFLSKPARRLTVHRISITLQSCQVSSIVSIHADPIDHYPSNRSHSTHPSTKPNNKPTRSHHASLHR